MFSCSSLSLVLTLSGLLIFCAVVLALLVYFVMSLFWGAADQLSGIQVKALESSVGDSELALSETLPIARDEGDIKKAIRENTVVAIKAETGNGKTMLGPQFLRQQVGNWPVLIVQKSCFAAE